MYVGKREREKRLIVYLKAPFTYAYYSVQHSLVLKIRYLLA